MLKNKVIEFLEGGGTSSRHHFSLILTQLKACGYHSLLFDQGQLMSKIIINKKIPNFSFTATSERHEKLSDLKGQNLVLYFYPRDNTPGCTTEGNDFSTAINKFKKLNTTILGVSRDSLRTHENFKAKQEFKFDLISDSDETLCQLFDVIKEKNMYGKKLLGVERSTFLIDDKGVLQAEWRKVKVTGHVDAVLVSAKELLK
jgi:peroxiredoxin Q/BCP